MKNLRIEQTNEMILDKFGMGIVEFLISQTHLASRLNSAKSETIKRNPGYSNGDIAKAYIGLLCLGKNKFAEIEPLRSDYDFRPFLKLERVPSPAVLEHRLDEAALSEEWKQIILEESLHLLRKAGAPINPVTIQGKSFIPVDVAMPFAFIGKEGYCLSFGQETSVSGRAAEQLAEGAFLWRLEAKEGSEIAAKLLDLNIDFVMKLQTDASTWVETARKHGTCSSEREGKNVYFGSVAETNTTAGAKKPAYYVFKLIETTIDKNGQILLIPEYEADVYMTTLDIPPEAVPRLYDEHRKVCKSLRREFMSDLGFKQLPSRNQKTNELALHFGIYAYNLLRFAGQGKARLKRIRETIRDLPKMVIKEVEAEE
ncbi:transposase [Heyndrickxia coagulans]|uniref:transposase n=1 Tax=Heyndrickxia coagulans TaxID=1398 RepID=UPI000D733FAA|nr:transposase [Heyndrickxia coagulans]AWP36653.1 transposase [Heyndrickxia coagulans]QDI62154.1 transposase [Heyndrickxia coagulans]